MKKIITELLDHSEKVYLQNCIKKKSKHIVVMDDKKQKIRVNYLAEYFTDISTEPALCTIYRVPS